MTAERIVCWFSCGAASAVATKLAISENAGRLPIVVARIIIREEHEDNERFAADCEQWFGAPITSLIAEKYDGSVDLVVEKRQYMSGPQGAPCTMLLKKDVRRAFERPTDRHVFGYCAEEQKRWDEFLDANNIDAASPLIDRGLKHEDTLAMIQQAGIRLPVMYELGYEHNNCIGCLKASGAGYWNKIRIDFPGRFAKLSATSRKVGARLTRNQQDERIFLDELEPGWGNFAEEPKVQCGIFCHMAEQEYSA